MNKFYSFFVITVLAFGLVSTPFSFAQSNNTNLGQEVSNFVHETRELFEQQGAETKTVIAQCREDMANAEPSERESVRDKCKSNLEDIRESYKLLREIYREAFLLFKENMKVFIAESRGLPIDSSQRDAAIANIKALDDGPEKRELRELKQKMNEQIHEDAQKQREQEKREREIAREELKAEKKEEHKALKIDQEKQRGLQNGGLVGSPLLVFRQGQANGQEAPRSAYLVIAVHHVTVLTGWCWCVCRQGAVLSQQVADAVLG